MLILAALIGWGGVELVPALLIVGGMQLLFVAGQEIGKATKAARR